MTILKAGVDVQVIPKLNEGERLIFHVEVGDLPPKEALAYLEQVRTAVLNRSEDDAKQQYLFAPMRHGSQTVIVDKLTKEK